MRYSFVPNAVRLGLLCILIGLCAPLLQAAAADAEEPGGIVIEAPDEDGDDSGADGGIDIEGPGDGDDAEEPDPWIPDPAAFERDKRSIVLRVGSGPGYGGKFNPIANNNTAGVSVPTNYAEAEAAVRRAASDPNAAVLTARLTHIGETTLDIFRRMVDIAGDRPLYMHADSLMGEAVLDVRLTIKPADATQNLDLFASTVSSSARRTRATFESFYTNAFTVVSLDQPGAFGLTAQVAVKPDAALDTSSLLFYQYDLEQNTCSALDVGAWWMDSSGYLHFQVQRGGNVVVTDRPLQAR